MITLSWLILLVGLIATAWVFAIKGRGVLSYWVRPVFREECCILGKSLSAGYTPDDLSAALSAANAEVRSHDQAVKVACRLWNEQTGGVFVGVLLDDPLEESVAEGFELRQEPAHWALRVSGANKLDETKPRDAAITFAKVQDLEIDLTVPQSLKGQSFQVHEWRVTSGTLPAKPSALARMMEWTMQSRDNLIFTVLLTVLSAGALGTKQPFLFAIGVCLMVFLSGACKFVFLHQRTDEADEMHLQNY